MTAAVETLPVLTGEERQLLAAVHRWAREHPAGSNWPRWERGLLPGMWVRFVAGPTQETAEVAWGPASDHRLTVEVKAGRWGETLLDETVTPRTVRQAVDLLVAWGILPVRFSSAFTAGGQSALLFVPAEVPQPWLPQGWHPDAGDLRPLPRLLGFTPLPDPALRGGA